MARYVVVAACVVAADRYLYRDATLPEGVDQATIEHLLGTGLIAEVEEGPEPDSDNKAGDDNGDEVNLTSLKLPELLDYAGANDVDLKGATLKADVLAAIQAHADAQAAADAQA